MIQIRLYISEPGLQPYKKQLQFSQLMRTRRVHRYLLSLVVGTVALSLGIKDTTPVVGFKVEFGVDINLNFNVSSALLDRVSGDTRGGKGSTDELSDTGRAPFYNFTSLQVELSSKNGVLDGSVIVDLSERQRLVDRGALVTKGVNRSRLINSNTDGQTSSDTRCGGSSLGKLREGDAWDILQGWLVFSHVQCSRADGLSLTLDLSRLEHEKKVDKGGTYRSLGGGREGSGS